MNIIVKVYLNRNRGVVQRRPEDADLDNVYAVWRMMTLILVLISPNYVILEENKHETGFW